MEMKHCHGKHLEGRGSLNPSAKGQSEMSPAVLDFCKLLQNSHVQACIQTIQDNILTEMVLTFRDWPGDRPFSKVSQEAGAE